jgi:hypothetical protein
MEVKGEKAQEPRFEEATSRAEPEPKRIRKPYERPAFRAERVFETMALACGKTSPGQGGCNHGRRKSS